MLLKFIWIVNMTILKTFKSFTIFSKLILIGHVDFQIYVKILILGSRKLLSVPILKKLKLKHEEMFFLIDLWL